MKGRKETEGNFLSKSAASREKKLLADDNNKREQTNGTTLPSIPRAEKTFAAAEAQTQFLSPDEKRFAAETKCVGAARCDVLPSKIQQKGEASTAL